MYARGKQANLTEKDPQVGHKPVTFLLLDHNSNYAHKISQEVFKTSQDDKL